MQRGYDSAVRLKTEDLLDRWVFAQEIFNLASNCPEDWSVRIAVYGAWGSGKTSVLNFVEHMAEKHGHTVVWFNPWGVADSPALWRTFINAVLSSIKDRPLGPDTGRARIRERARRFSDVVKSLSTAAEEVEKFVNFGVGYLEKWIGASKADLREVSAYFEKHRIVVLIDDLDRASPNLVPEILYALKEILDLPSFSFVLGFDRDRVGAALAQHHPGWGTGLDFLDKIIDFPRWLPSPTGREILALADADRAQYASFVDSGALQQVAHVLPGNPRALRKFIRNLWSLEAEVKRYAPDELDWPLMILLGLFRAQWPIQAESLLEGSVISELSALASPLVNREGKEREVELDNRILALLSSANVDDAEQSAALALLREILRVARWLPASSIVEYAFLVERPTVLTKLEFGRLFDAWCLRPDAELLSSWVFEHERRTGHGRKVVWDVICDESIQLYEERLSRAVNERVDVELVRQVEEAGGAWDFIQAIWSGSHELSSFLGARHFVALVVLVGKWARFTNHSAYIELRRKERQLLSQVMARGGIEPLEVWQELGPYNIMRDAEGAERRQILEEVESAFAPLVAEKLLEAFGEAHALDAVLTKNERYPERELLFDRGRVMWSEVFRSKLLAIMERAESSRVVHENVFSFFLSIAQRVRRGVDAGEELPLDAEVLSAVWRGVISRRLNPRHAGSLAGIVSRVEAVAGIELERPVWWNEVVQVDVRG